MPTWQAIVDGTTYNLSDANPFRVLSATGIGNAPVRRLEERGPLQDGVTDVGYRLDPRIINLEIAFRATSLGTADTHRDTLSALFSPVGGRMVQLRVTRDDGAVRQIDCYAVGLLDMPATLSDRVIAFQRVGVQLKAPNPVWYEPTQNSVPFTATSVSDWYLGGGLVSGANVLTYAATPAVGQVGTIGTPTYWTILALTTGNPASGTQSLWSVPGIDEYFRQGTAAVGTVQMETGVYTGVFFPAGSTVARWFQHGADEPGRVKSWYGTALTLDWATGWVRPLGGNTIRWRDRGAGVENWAGSVTHVAVYNTALNATQRSAVEAFIAGGALSGTATISGTWDEFPVISLVGPMSSPVITNYATGEQLSFTGATIAAGEAYQIDTRYGRKTVTNTAGSPVLDKLTDDSDLATFHLAPGANYIQVSAAGTSAASTVSLSYYNRYLGL
jgi:hypothetical protein